jgi:hypothetical protein
MKIRLTLLVITLMMSVFCAGCPSDPFGNGDLSGNQCPEGTTPVMVVTPDGGTAIECVTGE